VGINAIDISNRPIRLALAGDNKIYKYLAQEVLLKYGNSNYGFHLAGSRGLFLKAAKNYFILLNGSVALKFVIGQPQRRASAATDAFSACLEPLFKATGALDKLWKDSSCGL